MCKPLADPVFDIGKYLQRAYEEGYRQGRYDEKVYLEDCISRQEAIKVASGYCHPANIADELRKLPPAQPMRWIPCSERLPDDLEEVNVTWVNHDPEPYYNFVKDKPFTATAVYYKEKWYWYSSTCADLLAEYRRNPNQEIDDGIEITAWMPLPEPYKGEQV